MCKRFEGIVKESVELQYNVELAIAGYQDGGHVDLPFAVRLQKLRDQENAWWNLSWSRQENIPQHGTTAAYDFHGGVWARGTGERYAGLSRKIELSVLPSPWIPPQSRPEKWTFSDLTNCRDFAIDPSQDLFVWIESDFVFVFLCLSHFQSKVLWQNNATQGSCLFSEYRGPTSSRTCSHYFSYARSQFRLHHQCLWAKLGHLIRKRRVADLEMDDWGCSLRKL